MNNFPPVDDFIIRKRENDWLAYQGGSCEMVHGFSLELRPGCDYSRRRYVYRKAEASEIYFLQQFLKKIQNNLPIKWSFFDIGANIGYWSKMLAISYFESKIYSFEPDPITFSILKKNILNLDNISIFNYGLGDKSELKNLYVSSSDSGDNTLIPEIDRDFINIQIKKFDDFIAENRVDQVNFIKIDIQGYETEFLLGAEKTINQFRPIILVEIMQKYDNITNFIYNFSISKSYLIYIIDGANSYLASPIEFLSNKKDINIFLIPNNLNHAPF